MGVEKTIILIAMMLIKDNPMGDSTIIGLQNQMDLVVNIGTIALTGLFVGLTWLTIMFTKSIGTISSHNHSLDSIGKDVAELKKDLKLFMKQEIDTLKEIAGHKKSEN